MRVKMIEDEIRPLHELGLRFGDVCRALWLAPISLRAWLPAVQHARRYRPRHSLQAMLSVSPDFMSTWHLL